MGQKYAIYAFTFPYTGYAAESYSMEDEEVFYETLAALEIKYPIITVEIRNHAMMNELKGG